MSKQTFNWPVRVYYEDTDAGGVVYHSNYLNFMERARTEWLRALGFEQTYLRDVLKVIFVVHSAQIAFKKPAKFNDLLTISSEIGKVGQGSLEFSQKISVNQASRVETITLVEATIKVACVEADTFKPTAIPKEIKVNMEQI
ncbi:MAG TPA: tol-pal system-associated acyl-CoA thioesterase [Methylotenera sp.]|nr:tol-pal system-associated acyl-CoA thioesterase [Methylotenera sp.]